MSIEMVLYLINLVDNVSAMFCLLFLISIVSTITILWCRFHTYKEWLDANAYLGSKYADEADQRREKRRRESHERFIKYSHWSIYCLIPISIICLIIPSQATMRMMLSTNVAKKSEIPEKVLKAIEGKLDEYIEEIKDKVK